LVAAGWLKATAVVGWDHLQHWQQQQQLPLLVVKVQG